MSQAAIRDRIRVVLDSVDNIGVVHDYERFNSDLSRFMALFRTKVNNIDQIRGAQIVYRGFTQQLDSTCDIMRFHNFLVITFLGVDDGEETAKTAADLVAAIVDDLDSDATLNSAASYVGLVPSQIDIFEPRVFGDVLCHYSEIRKTVPEEFNWSA